MLFIFKNKKIILNTYKLIMDWTTHFERNKIHVWIIWIRESVDLWSIYLFSETTVKLFFLIKEECYDRKFTFEIYIYSLELIEGIYITHFSNEYLYITSTVMVLMYILTSEYNLTNYFKSNDMYIYWTLDKFVSYKFSKLI